MSADGFFTSNTRTFPNKGLKNHRQPRKGIDNLLCVILGDFIMLLSNKYIDFYKTDLTARNVSLYSRKGTAIPLLLNCGISVPWVGMCF